jgi:hypothetical protein
MPRNRFEKPNEARKSLHTGKMQVRGGAAAAAICGPA